MLLPRLFSSTSVAFVLLFLGPFSWAQMPANDRISNLKSRLSFMQENSDGVMLLDEIACAYEETNLKEVPLWAHRELKLAQKIGFTKGEAMAYNHLGTYHREREEYTTALEMLQQSKRLIHSTGDFETEGQLHNSIGTVYWYMGNLSEALNHYQKSLQSARKYRVVADEQVVLNNIGQVLNVQRNYSASLKYLRAALQLARQSNDSLGILSLTQAIGTLLITQNDISTGLMYHFWALSMAMQVGEDFTIANVLQNVGADYFQAALYDATPNNNLLLTTNRMYNLERGIYFLQGSLRFARKANAIRVINAITYVQQRAQLFKQALEKGPIAPADMHLYY